MNQVQKLIFFLALIQLIYCDYICKFNKTDSTCYADDDTYSCIGNSDIGCTVVPRCNYTGPTEADCSKFPVSRGKSETDLCMKNSGSYDKPCIQKTKCKFLTGTQTDDNICRQHPVTPELADKYTCILNKTSQNCEETLNCDKVPQSETLDCKNFAADVRKICKENEYGDTKCREESICGKENGYWVSDAVCMEHNIVSDDKKFICLKKITFYAKNANYVRK